MGCASSVSTRQATPLTDGPQKERKVRVKSNPVFENSKSRELFNLPIDLYILIRSYLFSHLILTEGNYDSIEKFVLRESQRSWRNFLSISNHYDWKIVRKATMVWSLNNLESDKYLKEDSFRVYLDDRMDDPLLQLQCQLNESAFPAFSLDSALCRDFSNHFVYLSQLSSLSLSGCTFKEFPSCESLQKLHLTNCKSVKNIGTYPKLLFLFISKCDKLISLGTMKNLTHLRLNSAAASLIIPLFPLENLVHLSVFDATKTFLDCIPRFLQKKSDNTIVCNLRELSLINNEVSSTMVLPALPFQSLEKLSLACFHSIELNGLSQLKELCLEDVPEPGILGKEEIFPQLKVFSYIAGKADHSFLSFLPNMDLLQERTVDLSLSFSNDSPVDFSPILQEQKELKSFCLSVPECYLSFHSQEEGNDEQRIFHRLSLKLSVTEDLTNFPVHNIQILELIRCKNISSISPVKEIPYLRLTDLPNVKEFSCLGEHQKCLIIDYCPGLRDKDFRNFGKVFSLSVHGCENISVIQHLQEVRYLDIWGCCFLEKVDLEGMEYLFVEISSCSLLKQVNVEGRLYSLKIGNCHPRVKNKQFCQYFNERPTTKYSEAGNSSKYSL
jgi:hypothetical protein